MAKSSVSASIHFVDANPNASNESVTFGQLFKQGTRFKPGMSFTIKDVVAKFAVQSADDVPSVNARKHVLLVTDVDDENGLDGKLVIWLTTRYNRNNVNTIDTNGNDVLPDGTFDADVFAEIDKLADKSADDAVKALRKRFKDAKVVVRRKAYTGLYYGRAKTMTMPVFDNA